ncbi:hypothetical protein IPV09_01025 [Tessaracoccus sp. SD287]|uniref:hypothetical protein n=1 Tax=Tessaracoccus sp. SD287 TaxID=2782008 RepID=UPI001A95DC88|nr:hypothetical protein [Tessaracoccus sp. SD287]MBO1029916.1 hypothetical protein [Tessaracoccus sp. SD287]
MPRRVSLPGASELFRRTEAPPSVQPGAAPPPSADDRPASRQSTPTAEPPTAEPLTAGTPTAGTPTAPTEAVHTGRVRHDEKMTVYVSATELVALEQARLTLRAEHGLKADRGRIVRAAVAMALADLAEHGSDGELARRLRTP